MAVEPPRDEPAGVGPVLRPLLPDADRLLPYLRRIDAARVYSNYGPLVAELEERLRGHFGGDGMQVVTAASGFSALVGAILAAAGRASAARPYALLPSYTFIATASAVEQCGYVPLLADVDADTWQLAPATAETHAERDRIGVVVPVAPLGRAVAVAPWEDLRERTGLAVAVDGAASFDRVETDAARFIGAVPVALSFHATKSFACGEGGAILCRDAAMARRAVTSLNFGFYGARDCLSANLNGKMNEYSAAVALAELDGWERKREAMVDVAAVYREAFARHGLEDRLRTTPVTSAAYVLFDAASDQEAVAVERALVEQRIDFRRWYGHGLHRQTYYADVAHGPLPRSESIARRLLGLPFAPDLARDSVRRVAAAIAAALPDRRPAPSDTARA